MDSQVNTLGAHVPSPLVCDQKNQFVALYFYPNVYDADFNLLPSTLTAYTFAGHLPPGYAGAADWQLYF